MATPVKLQAIVRQVWPHTDTVASYRLEPQGRVPKFHAGQFLHLALDAYAPDRPWPESRIFSIASAPSERAVRLDVTVSAKGRFTRRLLGTLRAGDACWLKLPYGEFLFPPDRPLVLIAGGVGITPYLSLLRQRLEERSAQPLRLHYGVRSASHYLFGDLLDRCAAELPDFALTATCEDGSRPGRRGRPDVDEIVGAAPAGALFYLSGPPAMIEAFRRRLAELDVAADRIRVDDWE